MLFFVLILCFNDTYSREVIFDIIETPRVINNSIDMISGGIIVVPDDPQYKDLAVEIQSRLKEVLNVEYSISNSLVKSPEKKQLVIAVGNMMNNPVIERLYWNFYTFVNPSYPGNKGFVIETVYQPLPILPNNNVIVIGASTLDNTKLAVKSFLGKIKSAQDHPDSILLEVSAPKNMEDETKYYLKTGGLRGFRGMSEIYHLTGEKKYLKDSIRILDEHINMALSNPGWIVSWGDEIDSFKSVQAWDFIQEHAVISIADFLKYEQFFLNLINKLSGRAEIYGEIKPGPTLAWNHTTIPLLGMYTSARYYKAHYGFKSLDFVMEQVDTYLEGQKNIGRVSCDSVNYLIFSLNFCLAYYNMTGQMEFYENGSARKITDLIFAQVDNNGFAGGTGDITPFFDLRSDKPWFYLEWKLQMPQMYWFRKQSGARADELKSIYYPGTEPVRPDYLEGCVAAELDRGMYDHIVNKGAFRMPDQAQIPKLQPTCHYDKTFDKLQFRSFNDAGGEYLLVDGLGSGNHGHRDTGAIVCGTFEGCRFLDDSDKLIDKSDEHTMVTVIKDGESQLPVPPLAELKSKFNFSDGAYSCISVNGYNGTDWNRHIFWLKDKYFIVFDTVAAIANGSFRTDCVWKLIDRGNETYDGFDLKCSGPHKKIDKIKDIPQKTFNLRSVDAGWITRRIDTTAEFPTLRVHQVKNAEMKQGDMISYQNVFYLQREDRSYKPHRISQTEMLFKSGELSSLVVVGKGTNGLECDSSFIMIDSESITACGISVLKIDGITILSSTEKVDIKISGGKAEINAHKQGKITIGLAQKVFSADYSEGITKIGLPESEFPAIVSNYISGLNISKQSEEDKSAKKITLKPLWQSLTDMPDRAERGLSIADLNSDGQKSIIVASGREVLCLSWEGDVKWRYQDTAGILSCEVIPLTPEGIRVIAGTDDGRILGLSYEGKFVNSVDINVKGSAKHGSKGRPWVTHLIGRDLGKDGSSEIIAGLRSWNMYIYNNRFEQIWSNSMVLHGVSDIQFGDADKNQNLLYVGDKYGNSHLFDINVDTDRDVSRNRNKSHIGDVCVIVADVNGDGTDDIINASSGGRMAAFDGSVYQKVDETLDPEVESGLLWQYCNYGFGFSSLGFIKADEPYIIAGSASGYLSFINPTNGKLDFACDLFNPISCVAVVGEKIIAGSELGDVFEVSLKGNILNRAKVPGGVLKIAVTGNNAVVLDKKGNVSFFNF